MGVWCTCLGNLIIICDWNWYDPCALWDHGGNTCCCCRTMPKEQVNMGMWLAWTSMGIKSHQMDVETPVRGIWIPEACTREKGGSSTICTLEGLDPEGSFPSTMTLAFEGTCRHHSEAFHHPVGGFWHEDDLVGMCGNFWGVLRPNISLWMPSFPRGRGETSPSEGHVIPKILN